MRTVIFTGKTTVSSIQKVPLQQQSNAQFNECGWAKEHLEILIKYKN